MDELKRYFNNSGNLYHAYFLVGGSDTTKALMDFFVDEMKIVTHGNPDFYWVSFKTLTVDHAHNLSALHERKEFAGGRKIFVIETNSITEEAQNSLLKVFEEPTAGTHFFIISPQDNLLPTLRSRMQVIVSKTVFDKKSKILNLGVADRLEKVKEIADSIKDEDATKQDAIDFLNQIEDELYEKGVENNYDSLKICERARASLYDRGAPVKMILENVVLSI